MNSNLTKERTSHLERVAEFITRLGLWGYRPEATRRLPQHSALSEKPAGFNQPAGGVRGGSTCGGYGVPCPANVNESKNAPLTWLATLTDDSCKLGQLRLDEEGRLWILNLLTDRFIHVNPDNLISPPPPLVARASVSRIG